MINRGSKITYDIYFPLINFNMPLIITCILCKSTNFLYILTGRTNTFALEQKKYLSMTSHGQNQNASINRIMITSAK